MSREPNQAMTDAIDRRRVPAPMSRLVGALLADLKLVDCGSLDVLVYCRDDLVGSAPGEWPLAVGVDGT